MSNKAVAIGLGALLVVGGAALAGPERVEFPKDYKSSFTLVTTRDMHRGGNTVVDIYANPVALKAGKADVLPSGSIILMEAWSAKLDGQQQPEIDAQGRMIKDQFRGIVMMEKRAGWGEAYPANVRNGDWEYAAFSTAGERRTGPTADCFECHGGVKELDYVFAKPELVEKAK
jgi:hypothetical protein